MEWPGRDWLTEHRAGQADRDLRGNEPEAQAKIQD